MLLVLLFAPSSSSSLSVSHWDMAGTLLDPNRAERSHIDPPRFSVLRRDPGVRRFATVGLSTRHSGQRTEGPGRRTATVDGMISAVHNLVYSDDPTATRTFFRDVLRWPYVSEGTGADGGIGGAGTGGGSPTEWLIFATGPSELGVHPTSGDHEGQRWNAPRHHSIALVCDDIEATMTELATRGATFAGEAHEMGFGRGASMHVPGADDMLLYQPHHSVAYHLGHTPASPPPS